MGGKKTGEKIIWHWPIVEKGCPSAYYYSFEISVGLFLALFQHLRKRKERRRKANNDARKIILCINFMPLSYLRTHFPHQYLIASLNVFSFPLSLSPFEQHIYVWKTNSNLSPLPARLNPWKVGLEGDQTSVMCLLLKVKIYNFSSSLSHLCN